MTDGLDALDRELLGAVRDNPRSSITQLSKRVGVARGTVYSRLDRLTARGVIVGYGPDVDPAAAGFEVTAFVTLEIEQGTHGQTTSALGEIPELLEIHTVTGGGDLLVRVIARTNRHLHEVVQNMTSIPTVLRTTTQLALESQVLRRVADVVADL